MLQLHVTAEDVNDTRRQDDGGLFSPEDSTRHAGRERATGHTDVITLGFLPVQRCDIFWPPGHV
jgi:hypothetical protein